MSSFYLGQLPGCLFWGWIADRYGRRKPLLVVVLRRPICVPSPLVDSIFVFVFAFIQNYYVAVVLRFIWGFCDGHYALIKTLVADYSDSNTIARNSSFLFLSVSIGKSVLFSVITRSSLSPLLGGYLSNPHNLSPWLLDHFPILLKKQFCFPFIVCGSLLAFCKHAIRIFSRFRRCLLLGRGNSPQRRSSSRRRKIEAVLRVSSLRQERASHHPPVRHRSAVSGLLRLAHVALALLEPRGRRNELDGDGHRLVHVLCLSHADGQS